MVPLLEYRYIIAILHEVDFLDSTNPRYSVRLPHGYGSSGIVSGSVSYLIKWCWSFLNSLWAPRYLTFPLVESPWLPKSGRISNKSDVDLEMLLMLREKVEEIHVRFLKSHTESGGFWGGPKTHQKWYENFFIDCTWKLSLLSIESCLLGPRAPRSKKPAGHPKHLVEKKRRQNLTILRKNFS